MTQINPLDYPVVFLSYDEPNADSNYEHLVKQRPDALRVHGIKGSDSAHKACAARAGTERFFTVDGDTQVDRDFWRHQHDLGTIEDWHHSVLSFSSRNSVNGLCYGNGGVKLWPRAVVDAMKTHELSEDPLSATDFCWVLDYVLMPGVWSQSQINHTEYQAWRAGFREGVKFTQIDGRSCKDPNLWQNRVAPINMHRLCVWQQLGMDVKHGAWSILGARQGFYHALLGTWPTERVQDFDYLADTHQQICEGLTMQSLRTEIAELGRQIRDSLYIDITVEPPSADISRWCRRMWPSQAKDQAKRLKS